MAAPTTAFIDWKHIFCWWIYIYRDPPGGRPHVTMPLPNLKLTSGVPMRPPPPDPELFLEQVIIFCTCFHFVLLCAVSRWLCAGSGVKLSDRPAALGRYPTPPAALGRPHSENGSAHKTTHHLHGIFTINNWKPNNGNNNKRLGDKPRRSPKKSVCLSLFVYFV